MRDFIQLFVNGKACRVTGDRAFMTLSDFLRNDLGLTGTKIVCSEGDCGSCSVLIGHRSESNELRYKTADSCIMFMHQLDQTHVVSIEGLGSPSDLSAVQQSMVDCHGSQCGYCTPGFVVAMHGLMETNVEDNRTCDEPLSEECLRLGLSGNLCRCTGYVQIIEAGRAVAPSDVPGLNKLYPADSMLESFGQCSEEPIEIRSRDRHVFVPRTLDQAVEFKAANPGTQFVSGATDIGVQHNHGKSRRNVTMCLSRVRELTSITEREDDLVIGASATWSEILVAVEDLFPDFAAVLTRFGSPQIRNYGTFGGNLANASPIADSIPFLYAIDATLTLLSSRGSREIPIRDFYLGYKQLDLLDDEMIVSIKCPRLRQNEDLKLYKVSKRRDMDISTFTAAFLLGREGNTITHARVALGGVGPTVLRVPKAESMLVGKAFTPQTMGHAGKMACDEITPISDVRGSDTYRNQVTENIFVKCYHDLAGPADVRQVTSMVL
ncbi:MAG: FAD binding domain-containing protein [Planctomycetota bacterium]